MSETGSIDGSNRTDTAHQEDPMTDPNGFNIQDESSTQDDNVIRVAKLGGAVKPVPFVEGMTAQQAIDQSGLSAEDGDVVQIDGAKVRKPAKKVLQPGDHIQITTGVSNG